jgi:hypothetical protein
VVQWGYGSLVGLWVASECKVCTYNVAFLCIPFFGGALVNVCLSVHSFMVSQTDFD